MMMVRRPVLYVAKRSDGSETATVNEATMSALITCSTPQEPLSCV